MINDLFPVLKGFDRTAGMNYNTKREIKMKSDDSELISDILIGCDELNGLLDESDELKYSYKQANDKKQEDIIGNDLTNLNARINNKFSSINGDIDRIRREVNKDIKYDPECYEPRLRMKNLISQVLQAKLYQLIKRSQKNQLEVRVMVEEKIARQLTIYDPTLNKDQVQQLIQDPEGVQEIVKQRMYAGTNEKVQAAIDAIKEKLEEIEALERNVNHLYNMIEDLSLIIKAQTDLVNSIEENMKGVKDFIGKMIENFEKAKKEYMTAQQKFCCIFICILVIMVIGVNYGMSRVGLI